MPRTDAPEPCRAFFVHVMKTGGTSVLTQALRTVPSGQIWGPRFDSDTPKTETLETYVSVAQLQALDVEERRRVRFFMGHWPYSANVLAQPDLVTCTVLRDPVERTLSYLAHCRRYHHEHLGMRPEEIYEDEWFFARFIRDHQTKVFSMTLAEALAPPPPPPPPSEFQAAVLAVVDPAEIARTARFAADLVDAPISRDVPQDAERLRVAKASIEEIEVLGVQERFDDFLEGVRRRLGWDVDPTIREHASEVEPASAAFRARIARDNALDVELVAHARELVAGRGA